jgi:maltooligosyltrehalose trehalohydrolase
VVVDPVAYQWRHGDWVGRPWHETVLYELHVGALGGFRGVAAQLPRLATLGVTAIELMPVAEFPGDRNWGYDGVLLFAPEASYGTPDDLKFLIDTAHGLGLMVFLDVVYNHFGPDGNYLGLYAPDFFRHDVETPWGAGIDFRRAEVTRFFADNALYWINEFRFDGLRFDALHAINEPDAPDALAALIRAGIAPGRHVHLVQEHEDNAARHLRTDTTQPGFDAQWNDDMHHCLHVLLTGEREGYYADYAPRAAELLARCLAEGFAWQGEASPYRAGETRGEPSTHLPPTAFVAFLQNHDHIGNRAHGERLSALAPPDALAAATTLLLLAPSIPLLFMGEEWASRQPFLYFTSHEPELAVAVREGRRREFARFAAFASEESRASIADPNAAETFARSIPDLSEAEAPIHAAWLELHRSLLALRHAEIIPRLPGCAAIAAAAVGTDGVIASWRMGDGSRLTIATNFGPDPMHHHPTPGQLLVQTVRSVPTPGILPPRCTAVWLETQAA